MKKGRILRTVTAVALILTLTIALAACGSKGGTSGGSYTIGFNTWCSGVPILDLFGDETEYALQVLDMKGSRASDDFTSEKELQNIQNFIAAEVDGIAMQCSADPVLLQAAEACEKSKTPFALLVFVGEDDDRAQIAANNKYYAGAVNSDLYGDGYALGKSALRDGNKTACIIGGNIGDNNMDQRIAGFSKSFVEEGGGKIIDEARCTSPAECLQKANDMLSAHRDVDCVYALVGDYIPGTITAMDTLSLTSIKVYASCVDLATADYIREGRVVEGNDGIGLAAVIAPAMLINFLDGHPIKGPDGKPAEFKTIPFIVNKDNVDDYVSIFYTQGKHPIPADLLKSLLWRNNSKVDYKTYSDLIASGLTLEALLKAHGK